MRCIGIDPGLHLTGYGCVVVSGGAAEPELVEAGVIRLPRRAPLADRLGQLHADLEELLERLRPDRMVVETIFTHGRHMRTSMLMGHARGVVLLAGHRRGLQLDELAPAEIKRAVTGRGQASKSQVQHAVQAQCRLAALPEPPDVADAIAIALCGARRCAGPVAGR